MNTTSTLTDINSEFDPVSQASLSGDARSGEGSDRAKLICICDTQPVTAEGIRTLLAAEPGLHFVSSVDSVDAMTAEVDFRQPDVLLLDRAFGMQSILDWMGRRRVAQASGHANHTAVVVWGVSITEAEALRLIQAGARGILRKGAGLGTVVSCLRTVSHGGNWIEDCWFRNPERVADPGTLTYREQQVLGLLEHGYTNKQIASELGICTGTAKIHLKHIFEKTGVRGRYALALRGLKFRRMASPAA